MDDATVGTMSRIATFVVPGNEWYPTEDLDTRPNESRKWGTANVRKAQGMWDSRKPDCRGRNP